MTMVSTGVVPTPACRKNDDYENDRKRKTMYLFFLLYVECCDYYY